MKFKPKRNILSVNKVDENLHVLKCVLPLYVVYNDINSSTGTTTKCHYKNNIEFELPFLKVIQLKAKKVKGESGDVVKLKELIKFSLCDEYFIRKFLFGKDIEKQEEYLNNSSADKFIYEHENISRFVDMLGENSYHINYNNSIVKEFEKTYYLLPENIEIVIVDPDFRRMKIDAIMSQFD
jgi:hypothetical protein